MTGAWLRRLSPSLLILLGCSANAAEDSVSVESTVSSSSPGLVVLIAVDQLRPDRLSANMPGGLGRLLREGYVFEEATLDHAVTTTCGGHVAIGTGVNPGKAGIPGNSFIDHKTLEQRYCVDDPGSDNRVPGEDETRSPRALTVTTLGDWIKAAQPEAKVVSIAGKDRAAITLAGHNADTVVWYRYKSGNFTTSTYYGELPDYVKQFNRGALLEKGAGARIPGTWEHPAGQSRPDDFEGESRKYLRVSGHPVNQGEERGEQVYRSAFLDELTGELVRLALVEESLGQRGVTDLLAMSFSATDTVGHLYGPYSAESEDQLRRLDAEIGRVLDLLDKHTGGDYVVALTADHGVMPLPEWLIQRGESACPVPEARIGYNTLGLSIYWHLYKHHAFPFSNPARLVAFSSSGLVVNEAYIRELGQSPEAVLRTLETYMEEQPWVRQAWTEAEMFSADDPFARLYRNSFVRGKSAHLTVQLEETCLLYRDEGTTHGSPYEYDRRVPLIFFGESIRQGSSALDAHSIDIAPTFADYLGLPLPDHLDGKVLPVWKTTPAK